MCAALFNPCNIPVKQEPCVCSFRDGKMEAQRSFREVITPGHSQSNGKIRIRFQVNLIPELTLNAQNCLYCPVKGAVEKVVEERIQG